MIMIRFRLLAVLCLSVIIWLLPPSSAQGMMEKIDLNDLIQQADDIVIGTVQSTNSQWNAEHTNIYTTVSISVVESLRGNKLNEISIEVPGGRVGEMFETVSDVPIFSNKEEVMLFLDQSEKDNARILGGTQGKLSVNNNKIGKLSLDDFKSQVKQVLQGEEFNDRMDINEALLSSVTIKSITPNSTSAGTNSQVVISGTGFGSNPGQVMFYYKQGQPNIQGPIVSWTDTRIVTTIPVAVINNYNASASSGPVYIVTSGGLQSNSFPFSVDFSYGSVKWPGDSPVVNYKVRIPSAIERTSALAAINSAASTWNNVDYNQCTFQYAGTTANITASRNGANEIMWNNLPDGTLASAWTWGYGDSIVETDIVFNTDYAWSVNPTVSEMDIEAIVLHEMGHWLNLRDLYGDVSGYPTDVDKVMFGYGDYGQGTRSLTNGDMAGIQWIYPTYSYQIIDDAAKTAVLTRIDGTSGGVVIPEQIDGYTIVQVGNGSCIFPLIYYVDKTVTSVTIPNTIVSIGDEAFGNCQNLTSFMIPDSVTSIGEGAFAGTKITSITIPASVRSIGQAIFSGCLYLESINTASNNTHFKSVNGVLFNYDLTELISYPVGKTDSVYEIPDTVMTIDESAFNKASNLRSITFPEGVTSIAPRAFAYCNNLTSVTIGSKLNSLNDWLFFGCTKLSQAKLRGDAPYIGQHVFELCAPDFKVYYYEGSAGFSNPWYGYTTECIPLTGIEITSPPIKTRYFIGQTLNLTGLIVTGIYSDGNSNPITVTAENVTGFDSSVATPSQTLTIAVGGKTATYEISVEERTTIYGDVNTDNYVNITDAVLVLKYITNPVLEIDLTAADVSGDGLSNITDAVLILQHITNPDVEFPIEN